MSDEKLDLPWRDEIGEGGELGNLDG
jgi:hypothetical protein